MDKLPDFGKRIRRGRQSYRVLGYADAWIAGTFKQDVLVELATRCPDCGAVFEFKVSRNRLRQKHQRRRCDLHKRPGVPAFPKAEALPLPLPLPGRVRPSLSDMLA